MIQQKTIALPPKSAFGFFSTVPFFGANAKFRRKVVQQLLSRVPYEAEIESMWASPDFPPHAEMQAILECIQVYNGWPNALFLPSDSFLALAPLEQHYDSVKADFDTVNDIFFILHPEEKERLKASKKIGDLLSRSLVACGDIPVIDTEQITPESTIADVLHLLAGSTSFEQENRRDTSHLNLKNQQVNHESPDRENSRIHRKRRPHPEANRIIEWTAVFLVVAIPLVFLFCILFPEIIHKSVEASCRSDFIHMVAKPLREKYSGLAVNRFYLESDFIFRVEISATDGEDLFEVAGDFYRLRKQSEPMSEQVFILTLDGGDGHGIRMIFPGKNGYKPPHKPKLSLLELTRHAPSRDRDFNELLEQYVSRG